MLPTSETISSERSPPPAIDSAVDTKVTGSEIPLTPPTPPASILNEKPKPTATIDDVGESTVQQSKIPNPPPPTPIKKKKGFFRRLRNFFLTLVFLGAAGFGGGVWYSRLNDGFHDFFTEYIPFGEQAVLYLEELEFKKRFSASNPRGPVHRDVSQPVKIPAQSGASWRVADQSEPAGRHASASSVKKQPVKQSPRETEEPKKSSSPKTQADKQSSKLIPAEKTASHPEEKVKIDAPLTSAQTFKKPEVNEPSRFPPLEPIDLMKLADAKEPIVRDLVHMLNDLILVINADGAHGKYSTTIEKAKNEISKVGSKLKTLKGSVEKKAAAEVKSTVAEFDVAATELIKRVENTMVQQELSWRQEFEEQMKSVREGYDERVKLLMEREEKLNGEKLKNQLLEQAVALKKEFVKEVQERVEKERDGRLGKLSDLSTAVSELEKLTVGWNSVVDTNLKTQQLHVAVEAVRANLEDAQHPRPFIRELVALKEIASDDAVVDAAIASINPQAYQRGIPSSSQLIDRFRRVANEVRKASLLPDDAGVASHASSWVLSHVMFKKQGLAEGDDVESVLTRTQTYLEEGDLDSATREMTGLQGWAKTLSKDWLSEARKVLEVQQALDVRSPPLKIDTTPPMHQ